MDLVQVSNGFSQLLPHQTYVLGGDGQPTGVVVSIITMGDLLDNVRASNPVHATPSYPEMAILPAGGAGNHFMMVEFTETLSVESVLSSSAAQSANNNLSGSIVFEQVDPSSGATSRIDGQVFINGFTYGGSPQGSPPVLEFQQWVSAQGAAIGYDTDNDGIPDYFPGLGYPGTEETFAGQESLTNDRTLMFVADTDNDLSTHETFPTGVTIHVRIQTGVTNSAGRPLARDAFASTTVGPDLLSPEVLISLPPASSPAIYPGGGQTDVDPLTTVRVGFSEPVQPWAVGNLPVNSSPGLSSSISLQFGPQLSRVNVPFSVLPVSALDLSTYVLTPAYNFPGEGPEIAECGVFNRIDVTVNPTQLSDFAGNLNVLPVSTYFVTGEGPGIVNAPVAPDVIYVTRGGAEPGVSVVDLNGFGQSTGNPTTHPGQPYEEGDSNFANNPNVALQGSSLIPPLQVGACTVTGGSSGIFTLTEDSSLNNLLIRTPVLLAPGSMMLGQALDVAFNNAPAPFGCQAGGGNICAVGGLKLMNVVLGGANTLIPAFPPTINPTNNPTVHSVQGAPNVISFAPHPNPPPLLFPPLCVSPFIGGQEPTSIITAHLLPPVPPGGLQLSNLLVPGANPLGNPATGVPPSTMLSREQNSFFVGPLPPQQNPAGCIGYEYMVRQQVGQFLYVLDRARSEVVVFNSNSMRVIERIVTPDPTSLAMSPNLDFLAVSNQGVNLVTIIDINPGSATFHQVVKETVVGIAPRGIAWEPGNEDILVANEGDNSVSIISAFSLDVRKVLSSQLNQPFEIAITGRQAGYGFQRNVYFAYIMNRTGKVALYESGPNGVNGWGYDDVIGSATMTFQNPKNIQVDYIFASSGIWIAHEGPIDPLTGAEGSPGDPALTNLRVESGITGQLPLNSQSLTIPQFRDLSLQVSISLDSTVLSGVPVDLAFDNQRNFGALLNYFTTFSAGVAATNNGKSLMRTAGAVMNSTEPNYMFVAVPSPTFGSDGLIDVIDISGGFNAVDTNAFQVGVQSITCRNASGLMDYFRQ